MTEVGELTGAQPSAQKFCPGMLLMCAMEGLPNDLAVCPEACPRPGGLEVERSKMSPIRLLGVDTVWVCAKDRYIPDGSNNPLQTS